MGNTSSFKQRYKYWKETGELPYKNGIKQDLESNKVDDSPVKSSIPYPMLTSSDYDDARAYELGYFNEAGAKGHLWSNDRETGRILKSPTHPTVGHAIWGDMNSGYDVLNKNGQYYSKPNFILQKINKLPGYDDGKDGDNIFKYTNSDGGVRYVYQDNPDAEEVPVRPLNTIFPDPAQWTFTDDAGKFYTPRRTTPTNTAELNPDNRTGFERALDNYIGEAFNTVPKGYHTLPAIGAAAFGLANPAIGEAALTSGFGAHGLSKWMNGEVNGPLDAAMTALEVAPLGRLAKPVYNTITPYINSAYNKLPWTYRIPENSNMAYRRMGPLERDWIMEGNELSTRETNALTEAEREAAVAAEKAANPNRRFVLFKAGAEHGGRKQFAKGQPWKATTVTHGEEQVLAIPGEGLPWVSGRHYRGPQGRSFKVGDISFEEAPFGSHIDLLTEEGYSGVNPSLLDGSVIYSPYKIFGHNFGYKKLYPKNAARTPEQLAILGSASDSPYKLGGALDLFSKHLYSRKIHGYPSYTTDAMQFDPVAGEFIPVKKEWADDVVTGLPNYAQDAIMHDVVDRNIAEFMSEGLSLREAAKYAEAVKKQLNSVRSGTYSQADYDKAGWGNFGGFYDPERNFISINEASNPKRVYIHEGRHLLDHKIDDEILLPRESTIFGTDFDSDVSSAIMQRTRQKQEMILRDAYDSDFESIPSSKYAEGLEDYNSMNREAITTNIDSRTYAYNNFADVNSINPGTKMDELPTEVLNAFIDNLTDELVFEAIEHANGYGKRYISRLRDEGKLTSKKAQLFREAMKHVGGYAIPTAIAAGALYGTPNKNNK